MALQVIFIQTLFTVSLISASRLTLTGSSDVVKEFLQPLTLNCTFQVTYDVNNQSYRPYFIYLLHETEGVIATIAKGQPISTNTDFGTTHSEGKLYDDDQQTNSSYLLVAWKKPSFQQAGQYSCVAHARNSLGRDNIYTARYQVKVETPNFRDWVKFVSEIEARAEDDREAVTGLNKTVQEMKKELPPHNEVGFVDCGGSNSYTQKVPGFPDAKEKEIPVAFKVPFQSPPTVIMNYRFFQADHRYPNRYYFHTRNVTSTGFNVVCGTWSDTIIGYAEINWYAIKN